MFDSNETNGFRSVTHTNEEKKVNNPQPHQAKQTNSV